MKKNIILMLIMFILGAVISMIFFKQQNSTDYIDVSKFETLYLFSNEIKKTNLFVSVIDNDVIIAINHHDDRISLKLSEDKSKSAMTLDIRTNDGMLELTDLKIDGTYEIQKSTY